MNKNIYEYLNYYKDYTFDDILFNQMDALVFSIIIYATFKNMKNTSSIQNLYKQVDNQNLKGAMAPIAIDVLEKIYNSKRYKDLTIYNLEKHEDKMSQFGAITLRYKDETYVVYEGTNASASGWMENFMLSCKFPTLTQEYAANYLQQTIKENDKKIYLCGHSKGGNLAMSSAMLCKNTIFNRIEKIYNFDGPGFRKVEYQTDRFKEVNNKTINILPEGSLIGILLFNDNYNYVKASGIGFKQHYPTNWKLFGEFFIKSSLAITSKKIKENMDKSLSELKDGEMQKVLDEVHIFLDNNNIYEKGFNSLDFNDFKNMILDINDVDEKTKKSFIEIIKLIFNSDQKKSK